eukprot:4224817-Alexandrium_andersonii.AAC.1
MGAPQTSGCTSVLVASNGLGRALPRLISGPDPNTSLRLGGEVRLQGRRVLAHHFMGSATCIVVSWQVPSACLRQEDFRQPQ